MLRLVAGLVNSDFDTVASMIQQMEPLPSFEMARSRLLLEESRKANDTSTTASIFVAAENGTPHTTTSSPPQNQSRNQNFGNSGGGRGDGRHANQQGYNNSQ